MKISKRCDYGLRALIYLASLNDEKRIMNGERLAKKLDIPLKFLFSILLDLKRLGYIQTFKGKSGGYTLGINPNDLLFIDIVQALDGEIYNYRIHFNEKSTNESVNTAQIIKETLYEAKEILEKGLAEKTLKELCVHYNRLSKEDADYSI